MGKAFNQAALDRVAPNVHHNDGGCFGCILGRLDPGEIDSNYDVNFAPHQVGGEVGKPINFSFSVAVRKGDVLSFYVVKLAQHQPHHSRLDILSDALSLAAAPKPESKAQASRTEQSYRVSAYSFLPRASRMAVLVCA